MLRDAIEAGHPASSVDAAQIARFSAQADTWWDPDGSFRALHRLNPARLGFIRAQLSQHFARDPAALAPFVGLELLDIGCGGGLAAEAMARLGFRVTGIDAAATAIAAAQRHGEAAGLEIDYRVATVDALARQDRRFDALLALELIEHLADPDIFYGSLEGLLRPNGAVIAATLNRTAKSFLLAIVGAEYILRWLPAGSHDWRRFVRPAELVGNLDRRGLRVTRLAGMNFDPRTGGWSLSADLAVNYLAMAVRS